MIKSRKTSAPPLLHFTTSAHIRDATKHGMAFQRNPLPKERTRSVCRQAVPVQPVSIQKWGRAKVAKTVLGKARQERMDEFYTQLSDIEAEMRHYKDHFKGKTVFCNCDDPYESNFFKYFAMNFSFLGLKKLIATCYAGSLIAGEQLPLLDVESVKQRATEPGLPHKIEVTEVTDDNADGAIDLDDVEHLLRNGKNLTLLDGDGDFRSPECIELLKEADIVVTNPPFSLFREYIAQLMEYEKKFIIIGSKNAITYRDVFQLIRENRLWLGNGFPNGNAFFRVPAKYSREWASGVYNPETGLVKFRNVGWFTNLDLQKRHEHITLYKQYTREEYPFYDSYDAINVDRVSDIPYDYNGIMGVPITFLDRYSPDQFDIVGLIAGNIRGLAGIPSKTGKDGPYIDGKLRYGRVLIKQKGAPQ